MTRPGERDTVAIDDLNLEDVIITVETDGFCLGECPAYSLKIYGDGTVEYHGRFNVAVDGLHTDQIPLRLVYPIPRLALRSPGRLCLPRLGLRARMITMLPKTPSPTPRPMAATTMMIATSVCFPFLTRSYHGSTYCTSGTWGILRSCRCWIFDLFTRPGH